MSSPKHVLLALTALGVALTSLEAIAQVGSGTVSYTGSAATQDFNGLASTSTSSTLPTGWYFAETGSNTNTTYTASDASGASISGDTFSLGTSGNSERAFGGVQSGSLVPLVGARMTNNSGATLTQLPVQFVGEQWRLGATARTDRLDFQYSLNATAINDGAATWVNVDALDFTAPQTAGTVGGLNGNGAANRATVTATIAGLNLANGNTVTLRWVDLNASGADDALGIDEVVFGTLVDNPPTVASSVPAHNALDVPVNTPMTVTFSEPVDTLSPNWFSFNCGTLTSSAGPATTFTLTPAASLPYSAVCTLFIDKDQIRDRDGTPDLMAFNESIQFETVADNPPEVRQTVPADTAIDVARLANLSVTFNEPVTAPAAAFSLVCPTASPSTRAFALSNEDDLVFTLDPTADLPAATSCVLSVNRLQVTDQDGTAHNPDLNTTVNFTTVAASPPAVVATTPAKNATNFPAAGDLQASFDATVNLAPGAFTLTCSQSTGISLTPNATSGSSFTISTGTTLVAGDSCTFTIVAANVSNPDGQLAANEVVNFTVAATGAGNYYDGVDASSCSALRTSLHTLIDDHQVLPYSGATSVWTMIEAGEEDPNDAGRVLDIYFNKSFAKPADRDNGTNQPQGTRYNREHTWPQSLGFASESGDLGYPNAPRSDGHHLFASEKTWNADRGNKPFADCPPPGCASRHTLIHSVTGGAGSNAACNHASGNCNWVQSPDGNTGSFEVWDRRKGDVARGVLYMDVRYEGGTAGPGSNTPGQSEPDLIVTDNRSLIQITAGSPAYMGLRATLLAWHAEDPPDEMEQQRNALIYSYQQNRNPFIDHPEWVECVFNCNCASNQAPSFSSTAPTTAVEDQLYSYSVVATDANGNVMTLTAPVIPAWLTLTATGNGTATLSGTPTNAQVGTHNVTLRVSDGIAAPVDQVFSITVSNSNDAPSFTSSPATGATEDALYSYSITTTDVDSGASLTLTAPVKPAWLTLSATAGSGTLSGTPTNAEVGTHNVTLRVSDGIAAHVDQTFTITVANTNDAPTVAQALPNRAAQEGVAITLFSVAGGFTDVDAGDDLDYSATNLPAGLSLNAETGEVSGTPAVGSATSGVTVTITAIDGGGLTAQQTFQYVVTAASGNTPPGFTSIAPTSATEGQAYTYNVTTTDTNGDPLTLSAVAPLPTWLTLTATGNGTATLSGTPGAAQVGTHNVTLRVSDGIAAPVDQAFTITVTSANPHIFGNGFEGTN